MTEGQVDANSMSLVDQTCLKIATEPMEHLELEGVTPSAELFRVASIMRGSCVAKAGSSAESSRVCIDLRNDASTSAFRG